VTRQLRNNSDQVSPVKITARRWLLAFAVLGLVTSGMSTWVHYRLLRDAGYTSFCDINPNVSCTEAYLSRFGSFAGMPVALLGFLWFVVVVWLAWLALKGRPDVRQSAPGYLFVLSTPALAMVLYLAYASFALLSAICVLCVGTWIAVAGVFLLSGSVMDYPMTSLPRFLARDVRRLTAAPVALVVALVFVGGSAAALAVFPREAPPPAPAPESTRVAVEPGSEGQGAGGGSIDAEFRRWYEQQPVQDPGVPAEGAAIVIVKFTDYHCPACAQAHSQYKAVLAKYQASHPGAVRYVVKNFPLDAKCNFNTPNATSRGSCEAAAAVRMAEARNRGAQMQDWLYSNQQILTPQSVRQAAGAIGGVPDFDAQYPKVMQEIQGEIATGGALNIRATPTFYINGRMLRGALPPQYFDQAIAIELERAAAVK
jgi:uncharacterized membrane protein/predicted DsbA family dithiol-disulfide isomerase